jgi:hypothetical protein
MFVWQCKDIFRPSAQMRTGLPAGSRAEALEGVGVLAVGGRLAAAVAAANVALGEEGEAAERRRFKVGRTWSLSMRCSSSNWRCVYDFCTFTPLYPPLHEAAPAAALRSDFSDSSGGVSVKKRHNTGPSHVSLSDQRGWQSTCL